MPIDWSRPIDALFGLGQPNTDQLQADVSRRLTPRPASPTSAPSTDRAVEALRKAYPTDPAVQTANIQDMPWSDRDAGDSNVKAYTNRDTNAIMMNPFDSAAYPDTVLQGTLAHELQHVRQNKAPGASPWMTGLQQAGLPHDQRPEEIDANAAAAAYNKRFTHGEEVPYVGRAADPRAWPGYVNDNVDNMSDNLLKAGIQNRVIR